MAFITKEIENYVVLQYNEDERDRTALIHCLADVGGYIGYLVFYKEGVPIPRSWKRSSGAPNLNFSERRFPEIMETLRQEKPVYIAFNDYSMRGMIKTSPEPVGEEEDE